MVTKTLGLRNNNPGNIEFGPFAKKWGGELGEGGRFASFPMMSDGFRVLCELLQAYYAIKRPDRIDTIKEVVNRWAPSNENNVKAYIADLCATTGLEEDDRLSFDDYNTLWWLSFAIAEHENGKSAVAEYVSNDDVSAGVTAALNS